MPNLCGNLLQENGGELNGDLQDKLVWAASSVMGGGLDTVSLVSYLSFLIFAHSCNRICPLH